MVRISCICEKGWTGCPWPAAGEPQDDARAALIAEREDGCQGTKGT